MPIMLNLFRLLSRTEILKVISLLSLSVIMATLDILGVASVMPFLALLSNPELTVEQKSLNTFYNYVDSIYHLDHHQFSLLLGIISFVFISIAAAFRIIATIIVNHFVENLRVSVSLRVLEGYLKKDYDFFLQQNTQDLSKTLLNEVDLFIGMVFRPAFNTMSFGIVFLAISSFLIYVDPIMAMIAFTIMGLLYGTLFITLRKKFVSIGSHLADTNSERFKVAAEVFRGIKILKVMKSEKVYLRRFKSATNKFAKNQARYETLNNIPHFLAEPLIFLTILALVILPIGFNGGNSSIEFSDVIPKLGVFALASYKLKPVMHNIYQGFTSLLFGKTPIENILRAINEPEAANTNSNSKSKSSRKIKLTSNIHFKNISYSYNASQPSLIKDMNVTIPGGHFIGITGPSGVGKTTLIDLLLGLHEPKTGQILIGDTEITLSERKNWQSKIGYAPQDVFIANSTIYENIALGVESTNINHEKVNKAAKIACLDQFIQDNLPQGYLTILTENGNNLSGGQKQRIGIARAIYKNPEILILDEATSALDNQTEQCVVSNLISCQHKLTTLMITHRLSTLLKTDAVLYVAGQQQYYLDTYENLVSQNPAFRKFSEQLDKGRDE